MNAPTAEARKRLLAWANGEARIRTEELAELVRRALSAVPDDGLGSSLRDTHRAPAGWVLVPKEPTDEMIFAAVEADSRSHPSVFRETWKAMLQAAPSPSVPTGDAEGAVVAETWESMAAWQRETFGPVALDRQARRAAEEMDELLADPTDVGEAADVCIVLAGYPGIGEAINRKMAINRAREWRLMGDGTGYHVKPVTPAGSE